MSPIPTDSETADARRKRGNSRIALICVAVFAVMTAAAFAAVPLYRAFCQQTGYSGTVRRAEARPGVILAQRLTVNFDTNVRDLPWIFAPEQTRQSVRIGDTGLAFFDVTNRSDKPITGRAAYNVVRMLDRATSPLLRPFRRFLPTLGGLDFSPLVLIIIITAAQRALLPPLFAWLATLVGGGPTV